MSCKIKNKHTVDNVRKMIPRVLKCAKLAPVEIGGAIYGRSTTGGKETFALPVIYYQLNGFAVGLTPMWDHKNIFGASLVGEGFRTEPFAIHTYMIPEFLNQIKGWSIDDVMNHVEGSDDDDDDDDEIA
ncbi:hypothetical protein HNP86_001811 [Methanococcus maripaludis]|uniref:Uncharacterized protein n=1 Tax=Methanococcus maripaludis TaxID=39152 RepID=A0A7J9NVE4_METMI|nr:hypothetical protein [Methanococcus maripaludis]MBA2851652.1 hypothetical protein [Methanococcus maripaludis]